MSPIAPLVAFCLPFLVASPPGPAQAAGEVYENAKHGFRVEVPEGWAWTEGITPGVSLSVELTPPADDGTTQLKVMVAPLASVGSPASMRTLAEESIAGQEQYSNPRHATRRVAGQDAPALVVDALLAGTALQLEQIYVEGNGSVFVLQSFAPTQDIEERAKLFAEVWSTFEITELPSAQRKNRRLEALAARCGSELDWAETWEDAAARARAEKKLVLVHARLYRGFVITDDVMSSFFMDPAIVDLVNERYVPFRLGPDRAVPFRAHDVYGLSPTSLGNAALLVTPAGEVVAEGQFPSYEFLLSGLSVAPGFPGPPAPEVDALNARAEMHLRRGENDLAEELLEAPVDSYGYLLRSKLRTWFRRGEDALADLERARESLGAEEYDVDLDVQQGIVLTAVGRIPEARRLFESVLETTPEHPRAAEAAFHLGRLLCEIEGRAPAEKLWNTLIDEYPESRWAWLAAATMTSTSYSIDKIGRLTWGEDILYDVLLPPRRAPLAPTEHAAGESAAFGYLISHQLESGAWLGGTELGERSDDPPHDFQLAATAICAQSLLPYREHEEAAEAVEKALAWLPAAYEEQRLAEKRKAFMDYSVWSRPYVVWFLADCVDAGLRDVDALQTMVSRLVRDLAARQKPGGGWSYYLSQDVSSTEDPANWAMSFTTAAVVHALVRAREVGFEIPDKVLSRALDCLEGMRNDDGTFEYMRSTDGGSGGVGGRPGAAGRGPVCAHALLRGGRGSLDELRSTLDTFVEHRAGLSKEAWKILMHTGPAAQGSHYVMFDYATIAVSLGELPRAERVRYRDAVHEELLKTHCRDGSFVGNPIVGTASSTGLALLAFTALRGDE